VLINELILIDTSVWVRYLRRGSDPDIVRQVRGWLDTGQAATTWDSAAQNGFSLHRSGVIVPARDLLIATVAQQFGARLAYADRHYELMAPHLAIQTISLL
jgi:predicted nucleic acid-binding protein